MQKPQQSAEDPAADVKISSERSATPLSEQPQPGQDERKVSEAVAATRSGSERVTASPWLSYADAEKADAEKAAAKKKLVLKKLVAPQSSEVVGSVSPPYTNRGGVSANAPESGLSGRFMNFAALSGYSEKNRENASRAGSLSDWLGGSESVAPWAPVKVPGEQWQASDDAGYWRRLRLDSLSTGYYYADDPKMEKRFEALGEKRDGLVERQKAGFSGTWTVSVSGVDFTLYPHGGMNGYAILLKNKELGIDIRADGSRPNNPRVKIDLHGRFFYGHTVEQAVDLCKALASHFGPVIRSLVSGLHIAQDLPVNPDFRSLFDRLRGHGKRAFNIYVDAVTGEPSTLSNLGGKKNVVVSIYKKHVEGSPHWLSYIQKLGLPKDTEALRLECRLSRKYLKGHGIDKVTDVLDAGVIRRIYRHVFTEFVWISADADDKRYSRASAPDWYCKAVQVGEEFIKTADTEVSADITTHRIRVAAGAIASEYAEAGVEHIGVTLETILLEVLSEARRMGAERAREYAQKAIEKIGGDLDVIIADAIAERAGDVDALLKAEAAKYLSRKPKPRKYLYSPKARTDD